MKSRSFRRVQRIISVVTGIALSACILTATTTYEKPVYAKTIAELDQEIQENKNKIADKQKELDAMEGDIAKQEEYQAELQVSIDLKNEQILLVDTQLTTIKKNIAQKETDVSLLEDDIAQQEVDIADGMKQFKKRLRAMYISGNDSLASALVGSTDFYDVLSKMDLISRVAKHDDELIHGLMDQLNRLNDSKTQLNADLAELDISRKEQEAKRLEYSTAIKELNEQMQKTDAVKAELARESAALEADISAYEKENSEKTSEQAKIAAEIKRQQELEEQRRKEEAANQNKDNPTTQPPAGNDDGGYTGGIFNWPVPGFYGVSSYYGYRWGRLHAGIDIAGGGISGAAVTSVESGTVTLVKGGCTHNYPKTNGSCGCNGGYGNYVVVSHGNGISTLYAHMASISVSYNQQVSAGTVLGAVGSTGWSTGPHLHFGVMKNGSFVNPAPYLGI